ncbi:hypothetical protein KAW50_07285 [candidate division WOR-3 bacterium]|nr:hypothetical protein [candidate division WOR-3 bacterium]
MKEKIISQIIMLVRKAQDLALKIGIANILQPGLVKEMIIAEMLSHELIISKRDADACDKSNPEIKYEYLCFYEGGTGQLDRVFKEPLDKRKKSLLRIKRNKKIYFAIFYKSNPLKIKTVYEIEPNVLLEATERQLDKSKNDISHVGFSENWAKENGVVIYKDKECPAGI